jgi:hypothetical protein
MKEARAPQYTRCGKSTMETAEGNEKTAADDTRKVGLKRKLRRIEIIAWPD